MKSIFVIIQFLIVLNLFSQNENSKPINSSQKEVYFSFKVEKIENQLKSLSSKISIEKYIGNTAYAYTTLENFNKIKSQLKDIQIIPSEFSGKTIPMAKSLKEVLTWNYYPTYSQYEQLITDYANNYPEICSKEKFGTSINGRNLWALKISDNVLIKEAEPEFLYTATIHGNEPLGFLLTIRLIDYLLTNYNINSEITQLINNHEIWINPLANPDGTYAGGDNTMSGATRFNSNSVDLNRNFPDPEDGLHPDGKAWQPENIAMMNFVKKHNFVISANLHTGSEVVNYPWDTWSKLHTDDAWFQKISHQYADTAQFYSPNGYLTAYNDGITNGYQWYTINGGAQDYMTYFQNCRSIILELCNSHLPDTSLLSNYWQYNYRSLINLIKNCTYGINGIVTDSLTGLPLKAEISIIGHDFDNSFVFSDSINGDFYRPITAGNYTVIASAPNYYSTQIDNISLSNNESEFLNIKMLPDLNIYPCDGNFFVFLENNIVNDKLKIKIVSSNSDYMYIKVYSSIGKELVFNKLSSICNNTVEMDLSNLINGIYYISLNQKSKKFTFKIIKI